MTRVGAVVNPVSGAGAGLRRSRELKDIFRDSVVQRRITARPGEVGRLARELAGESDLLASVGGDGTLRETVAALVDIPEPPPVFVVPAGRGNSVYRHLYGEREWRAVARNLADGFETTPLDVGAVTAEPALAERYFVLGFTAGLFRSAVEHAGALAVLPGRLAYVLGTARAVLGDDPVTATVTVDDEELFAGAARLVAVGGGRYRGSDFELFPDSRPGDGRLHAVVVEPVDPRESVGLVRRARAGQLGDHPAVRYATGERVTVTSETALPVEMDGTVLPAVERAEVQLVREPPHYAHPA
jgi:diacylglycerol kinase (ATP)